MHPIQAQIDAVNTELDALNMELNLCIKMGENTLTSDVTLTGNHTFCGATSAEIASLSGVTSNVQTQCDNAIKRIGTTALLGDVTLSGYNFCGVSVQEIGRLSGVTSNIQTQCDNAIKNSGFYNING